jgi:hypothetical protein
MYKLRHALPRIFIWLWGVRNCCARVTQWLRHYPQSRSWKWPVHVRGQALHKLWTFNVPSPEQSAVESNPRKPTRERRVRKKVMVMDLANLRTGQRHYLSKSVVRPSPRSIRNQQKARACPNHLESIPPRCRKAA